MPSRAALLATGSALAILASAGAARASGFSAARFGGEHGNVVESNPTALYYNPAGIAFSEGTHLLLDGSLAIRHATWEHEQTGKDSPEPPGAEGANYGTATLTNVFGGPAAGATHRIGDFALGAGFFVPFAGRAHWDPNEKFVGSTQFPLAADGVQRFHGVEGQLTFAYLTAGAAWRLGRVSIGASGNLVLSKIETTQAKSFTGVNDPDPSQEFRNHLDVTGTHGSFGVGVMVEAIRDRLWLGASYQAQPGLGPMRLSGTLVNSTTSYGTNTYQVDLTQSLPDVFRFGARARPRDTIEVRLFSDYTRWSKFVDQCIGATGAPCGVNADGSGADGTQTISYLYRGWVDTVGVRAGASDWIAPWAEVFAGAGYDRSAIPDATLDPNLPDSDTISAAAGARLEVAKRLFVAASYTHIQYLSRDNRGRSVLDAPPSLTSARPDGGGVYTAWIGVLDANVEKQF